MSAFGAAAIEYSGTGFGLHTGKKAMRLGAMAAVRLKGTLRHDKNSCAGVISRSNF